MVRNNLMGRRHAETEIVNNEIHKKCNNCDEFKSLSEFHKQATNYLGVSSFCKICNSKIHAKYYVDNKDKIIRKTFEYKKKSKYNLTEEEYHDMIARGCDVCTTKEGKMCVDHNHETNEVRGVLCHNCNAALGLLKEDENRILALAAYIGDRKKSNV